MTNDDLQERGLWVRTVVDRYEGPLVRYAARITGDVDEARDVVQEAFLRLCRERREEIDGHVGPWLFTVCRNRALELRRKVTRMKTMSKTAADACASREPDQADALELREAASQVLERLALLSENQQEVIRLKFQNGLSYREISGVTGLTVTNVGYLIHTAIQTLRRELAR